MKSPVREYRPPGSVRGAPGNRCPYLDREYNRPTMFNFEKLEVWNEAIAFADMIYATTKSLPGEERFGLTHQMRRAAVSIASNIAEGSSRSSRPDFARFIEIATGSVFEVVSQATISQRQGFLSQEAYSRIYAAADKQSRRLSGLRHSLDVA